ncbi:MAG: hypothetical protein ACTSXJ_08395 [Candidatus Baldrarchaeia archaeon]
MKELKDKLYELYWKRNLSLREIAEKFGVRKTTVYRWEKLNIPTRDWHSAKFGKRKYPIFNGDKCVKAYMIGFRLGDLNIRLWKNVIEAKA